MTPTVKHAALDEAPIVETKEEARLPGEDLGGLARSPRFDVDQLHEGPVAGKEGDIHQGSNPPADAAEAPACPQRQRH
jgi:hypothetical protein